MPDLEIKEDNRNSFISFHSFTRCDYISSFFRKGKTKSWKTMNSKSRFEKVMASLGENGLVDDEISRALGKFVCTMCGRRRAKYVNAL